MSRRRRWWRWRSPFYRVRPAVGTQADTLRAVRSLLAAQTGELATIRTHMEIMADDLRRLAGADRVKPP